MLPCRRSPFEFLQHFLRSDSFGSGVFGDQVSRFRQDCFRQARTLEYRDRVSKELGVGLACHQKQLLELYITRDILANLKPCKKGNIKFLMRPCLIQLLLSTV
jgi:hypothetical protein